jgi:hypothetical protein
MTETATAEQLAREAAETGAEFLKHQGWCLWKCHALGGDLVVVVRDDPPMLESQRERMMLRLRTMGVPYTIYTESELDILCENPQPQLLHEAKKAGATLSGETVNAEG